MPVRRKGPQRHRVDWNARVINRRSAELENLFVTGDFEGLRFAPTKLEKIRQLWFEHVAGGWLDWFRNGGWNQFWFRLDQPIEPWAVSEFGETMT